MSEMLSNLRAKRNQGETPGSPALPPYRLHAVQAIGAGFLAAAMGSSGAMAASALDIRGRARVRCSTGHSNEWPYCFARRHSLAFHQRDRVCARLCRTSRYAAKTKHCTYRPDPRIRAVACRNGSTSGPDRDGAVGPLRWVIESGFLSARPFGMGWTPALFVLLDHLVYGMLVGAIYKHDIAREG